MSFPEKLIKLRKEKGMTQEELAFEIGVSRQSVSKWETGEAEPNVSALKAIAGVFDVTLDFLMKEDALPTFSAEPTIRKVTLQEAQSLLSFSKKNSFWLALAAFLGILSPVCLIFLGGLSEYTNGSFTEGLASGIGMTVLLVFVAVAVSIFVVRETKNAPFTFFEKEEFEIERSVKALAEEKKAAYQNTYARNNALGVCLCILSLLPLFIGVMIDENNDFLLVSLTCCIFPIAGLGVIFFIRGGVIWESFEKLLQCGEYSKKRKEISHARSTLSWIYWLVVIALFLSIAIPTKYQYVGIIWVIAGVLYPAALAICDSVSKKK